MAGKDEKDFKYVKAPTPPSTPKPKKTYDPAAEGNGGGWNLDPVLNQAVAAVGGAGYTPGSKAYDANVGGYYGAMKPGGAAPYAPAPTGGASGGGGGGGGGGPSAAAMNAIKQLWAFYNKQGDNGLGAKLGEYTAQAQQTGQNAIQQLMAGLQAQQNPYSQAVMPTPQVAANPLAQYMQQSGASTSAVDSLQQMLAATNQQTQQADQSMLGRMGQAWNAQQQSRVGQVQQQGATFEQMLAQQQAGLQFQIQQQQQAKKDELMMQILQMAVSSGADLGKLGVSF